MAWRPDAAPSPPPRLLRMNDPAPVAPRRCDVLVVGGGPSGAACAYWLASAGHDVVMVERKRYPREKTCGDGLTPRSVRQLEDMGLGDELAGAGHRFEGLRSHGFGRTLELTWPDHPDLPGYGYVITRKDLDAMVAERASKAGATVWDGTEAVEPLVEAGLVRGARVKAKPGGDDGPMPGRHTGSAADARPGRGAGPLHRGRRRGQLPLRPVARAPAATGPTRSGWPSGATGPRPAMTSRGSTAGSTSATRPATSCPATAGSSPSATAGSTSGIGLLSTFNQWKAVNTTHLLQSFAEYAPPSWDIRPETACGPATGGRLPMGLSVGPHAGPTWLVVGDAGRHHQPLQRRGHRLRLRVRALGGRRRAPGPDQRRRHWPCRPTSSASTRPTPSTTRWPGPSCASSAGPS